MAQESGLCEDIRLKFDIIEASTVVGTNLLNNLYKFSDETSTSKVPFRLTPNLTEFMTVIGVNGVMSAVMISMARCLLQPQYNFSWLLRAILKDEILNLSIKKVGQLLKNTQSNLITIVC